MWKVRNFRKLILFFLSAAAFVILVGAFVLTQLSFYPEAVFFFWGNFILGGLYAVILLLFMLIYGCLRVGGQRMAETVFSLILSITFTDFIAYFILSLIAMKLLGILPMLLLYISQIIVGSLMFVLIHKIHARVYPAQPSVIICSSCDMSAPIISKICDMKYKYDVQTVLCENDGVKKLKKAIDGVSTVIFGRIDASLRAELMRYCFEHNRNFVIVPTTEDILINNAEEMQVDDTLTYSCRNKLPSFELLAVKRVIDILFSFVGLIIALPFMLVAALAIKLEDGGPVFYKQKRLTRNGHEFMLIKFRSMIPDAERKGGAQFAKKDDERITKVGRIIRATRIDELPQLINILIGNMSVVGPRPERPEMYEEGCAIYPAFRYRLKVKAGLTGFAQVYGKYNTSFADKARMDLVYIEKFSIHLDLRLMFYTLKIIFMKSSTEGFDKPQK